MRQAKTNFIEQRKYAAAFSPEGPLKETGNFRQHGQSEISLKCILSKERHGPPAKPFETHFFALINWV